MEILRISKPRPGWAVISELPRMWAAAMMILTLGSVPRRPQMNPQSTAGTVAHGAAAHATLTAMLDVFAKRHAVRDYLARPVRREDLDGKCCNFEKG